MYFLFFEMLKNCSRILLGHKQFLDKYQYKFLLSIESWTYYYNLFRGKNERLTFISKFQYFY